MVRQIVLAVVLGAFFLTPTNVLAQRGFGGGRGGFGGGGGSREKIEPEKLDYEMGVATISSRAEFEKLSYKGPDVKRDEYLANLEFVKFIVSDPYEDNADVYFMNTTYHRAHPPWMGMVGISSRVRGALTYLPRIQAPDGTAGLYTMDFQPSDSFTFEQMKSVHDLLLEHMPFMKGKLSFHPLQGNLQRYESEKEKYAAAKLAVHLDEHLYQRIAFLPLNPAKSFGRLQVMNNDARPSPRDVVICKTLPNQMPRVAGVITEVRQTPLSHVNLRAIQDKVPNAYINGALEDKQIASLVGKLVSYKVSAEGYSIREATKAEVDKHFENMRPAKTQSPVRNLDKQDILVLAEVGFEGSDAFGSKTANLSAMHGFKFPSGMLPEGHAVPFYFYDQFMKHNGFYKEIDRLLENSSGAEFDIQKELSKLRKAIRKGKMPVSMMESLAEVQKSFPEGTSIRCRSSTNNEDLPGFSGAGLYDSYTHKPSEGHLAETVKQVFASLWNFRAFEEREFYRIDHKATAMGVLLHPNYKGEKANGVAVTEDILYESQGNYYINTQAGEDLVTNPDQESSPEETLLGWWEDDGWQVVRRSNQVADGAKLLDDKHLAGLRKYLGNIHARFAKLYKRDKEDPKFAMEIEFKITKDDKLVIKQARPWVF